MRYWRIFNVDDNWPDLDKSVMNELWEKPRRKLSSSFNISYGPPGEPDWFKLLEVQRPSCMLQCARNGSFPLAGRFNKLTDAWTFIDIIAEQGIAPDICFLDVNLAQQKAFEDENTKRIIKEEIINALKEEPDHGEEYASIFISKKDLFPKGGVYLYGKIKRLFRGKDIPIFLYSYSPDIQREFMPMVFAKTVTLFLKNTLEGKWKDYIRELQIRKIESGEIDVDRVLNSIIKFDKFLNRISNDDEWVEPFNRSQYDDKIRELLLTPLCDISDENTWFFASFFVTDLGNLIDSPETDASPARLHSSLEEIRNIILSNDYCRCLTELIMNTVLILFGHPGIDGPYPLHPGLDSIQWKDLEVNSIVATRLAAMKAYWARIKHGQNRFDGYDQLKHAVEVIISILEDDVRLSNFLKDRELNPHMVSSTTECNLTDKVISLFRKNVSEELNVEGLIINDRSWLNEFNRYSFCMPMVDNISSPLKSLVRAIITHRGDNYHILNAKKFSNNCITLDIINERQGFDLKKLTRDDYFESKIGGLVGAIERAKGWIGIEIHSGGIKRNPHRRPYYMDDARSEFKDQSMSLFRLSIYCVDCINWA